MIERVPMIARLVVLILLIAIGLLLFLKLLGPGDHWTGSVAFIVLLATLVMLAVVWVQLAVQTAVAVLNVAQAETIRQAREDLFVAQEADAVAHLPCTNHKWTKELKRTADRVSQSWSTVAYLLKADPIVNSLLGNYIAKTRRTILLTRYIVSPRIKERRDQAKGGQKDVWDDFDWLARRAAKHLNNGEATDWGLPKDYSQWLRSGAAERPSGVR